MVLPEVADPQRRKSKALRLLGVVAIITAVLAIVTVLALPSIKRDLRGHLLMEPEFETDRALMNQTQQRLGQLRAELQSLPTPPGATERNGAEVGGCSTDSGDLFQPRAIRLWNISGSDTSAVAAAVTEAMHKTEWSGSSEPDRFGNYRVTAERGEWSAAGVVSASFERDYVFVEVVVHDARPCRLKPR